MATADDALIVTNAAYWLIQAAEYITEQHNRQGIKSTSYADSLRIEADELMRLARRLGDDDV